MSISAHGLPKAHVVAEELAIDIAAPSGPPMHDLHADTFHMQIWLIQSMDGVSGERRAGRT